MKSETRVTIQNVVIVLAGLWFFRGYIAVFLSAIGLM